MTPYFELIRWVAYVATGAGIWRYLSLPIYRLIAVYSRSPIRRRYALEVLRLARPDAPGIKSYLDDLPNEFRTALPSGLPKEVPNSDQMSTSISGDNEDAPNNGEQIAVPARKR